MNFIQLQPDFINYISKIIGIINKYKFNKYLLLYNIFCKIN
jgi:hypothetical protein